MLRHLVYFVSLSSRLPRYGDDSCSCRAGADREMMNKVRADRTITSQEISRKGYNFLHQLLSEEAGIHVVRSGLRRTNLGFCMV